MSSREAAVTCAQVSQSALVHISVVGSTYRISMYNLLECSGKRFSDRSNLQMLGILE